MKFFKDTLLFCISKKFPNLIGNELTQINKCIFEFSMNRIMYIFKEFCRNIAINDVE